MNADENELKRSQILDFRYSVVAELCNPHLSKEERKKLLQGKSTMTYVIPFSNKTRIGENTIKRWLSRYRQHGKEGLLPKQREDRGRPRSFTDNEANALTELLLKKPEVTVAAAIKKLADEGIIRSTITSSAASRFTQANALGKKVRTRMVQEDKNQLRFGFERPLECVQVDAMHGPKIPDNAGKKRKAILIAFLDDATRRVVFGRFAFSEKALLFEDGIKHVLLSHGRIGRLYCDNGSTFVSNQTKRITQTLGIYITHSKPYQPRGRGKVERYFRTVRDQFLRPLDTDSVDSLDKLNFLFTSWLETEYHRTRHSSLGTTPLEAWISKTHMLKQINPTIDLDKAFYHHATRKVYEDSVISLDSVAFEVPSILMGKTVNVDYDPHPPVTRVEISHGGVDYGQARPVDVLANAKVKRNSDGTKQLELETSDSRTNSTVHFKSINGE